MGHWGDSLGSVCLVEMILPTSTADDFAGRDNRFSIFDVQGPGDGRGEVARCLSEGRGGQTGGRKDDGTHDLCDEDVFRTMLSKRRTSSDAVQEEKVWTKDEDADAIRQWWGCANCYMLPSILVSFHIFTGPGDLNTWASPRRRSKVHAYIHQ